MLHYWRWELVFRRHQVITATIRLRGLLTSTPNRLPIVFDRELRLKVLKVCMLLLLFCQFTHRTLCRARGPYPYVIWSFLFWKTIIFFYNLKDHQFSDNQVGLHVFDNSENHQLFDKSCCSISITSNSGDWVSCVGIFMSHA